MKQGHCNGSLLETGRLRSQSTTRRFVEINAAENNRK